MFIYIYLFITFFHHIFNIIYNLYSLFIFNLFENIIIYNLIITNCHHVARLCGNMSFVIVICSYIYCYNYDIFLCHNRCTIRTIAKKKTTPNYTHQKYCSLPIYWLLIVINKPTKLSKSIWITQ